MWLLGMIGLISMGLYAVWQDASREIYFILHGIWMLPLTALMFIQSSLEKRKKRRVDMGLEEWVPEGKRTRKFRKLFRIIFGLVAVTSIVAGVVSRNRELSIIGGVGLVFAIIMYTGNERPGRAERGEQGEKGDAEGTEE